MSENFIQAITTLGTTPEDEESMLESRLYPKLNTEVGMTMTKAKLDVGLQSVYYTVKIVIFHD